MTWFSEGHQDPLLRERRDSLPSGRQWRRRRLSRIFSGSGIAWFGWVDLVIRVPPQHFEDASGRPNCVEPFGAADSDPCDLGRVVSFLVGQLPFRVCAEAAVDCRLVVDREIALRCGRSDKDLRHGPVVQRRDTVNDSAQVGIVYCAPAALLRVSTVQRREPPREGSVVRAWRRCAWAGAVLFRALRLSALRAFSHPRTVGPSVR